MEGSGGGQGPLRGRGRRDPRRRARGSAAAARGAAGAAVVGSGARPAAAATRRARRARLPPGRRAPLPARSAPSGPAGSPPRLPATAVRFRPVAGSSPRTRLPAPRRSGAWRPGAAAWAPRCSMGSILTVGPHRARPGDRCSRWRSTTCSASSSGSSSGCSRWRSYVGYGGFFMAREGEHNGQTPGKQIVGIRVIRDNGSAVRPRPRHPARVRGQDPRCSAGSAGFFFSIPTLLDVLWPLWDDQDRALHDMVVSTHVVRA